MFVKMGLGTVKTLQRYSKLAVTHPDVCVILDEAVCAIMTAKLSKTNSKKPMAQEQIPSASVTVIPFSNTCIVTGAQKLVLMMWSGPERSPMLTLAFSRSLTVGVSVGEAKLWLTW